MFSGILRPVLSHIQVKDLHHWALRAWTKLASLGISERRGKVVLAAPESLGVQISAQVEH